MRASAVALVAVGALLLASVPAVADHAYSHRYITYGRVVDAAGMPLEGVTVDFDMSSFDDYEGPCPQEGPGGTDRQQRTTDAMGRFFFCAHIHTSASSEQTFRVRAGGAVPATEKTVTSDPELRRSHVNFQLDDTYPDQRGDTDAFNSSYRVRGTVWKPADTSIARISVNGIALENEPVNATLTLPDGTTYEGDYVQSPWNTPRYNQRLQEPRFNATDRYGDFVFEWTGIPEDIQGGEITVTHPDETVTDPVDTTFRHHTAAVVLPGEGLNFGVLWILAGILGLGVVGYFGYGPAKERWDEYKRERRMRRLEEESDRKRS